MSELDMNPFLASFLAPTHLAATLDEIANGTTLSSASGDYWIGKNTAPSTKMLRHLAAQLRELAHARSIIKKQREAMTFIINDAREGPFGPEPRASSKHRKMLAEALALKLDEKP